MRIAMVAASWETDADEHRSYVTDLSSVLGRAGHDVTLHIRRSSPDPPARERTPHGFEIVRIAAGEAAPRREPASGPQLDEFADSLSQEWARRPPDVAHLHGRASGLAVSSLDIPVVQSFHHLATTRDDGRDDVDRLVAIAADRVLATGHWEVLSLMRMGVCRSRTAIVPRGVDTELFRPDGPSTARGGRARVLALGEVTRRSEFHTTISALPWIPGAELLITGRIRNREPSRDPEVRRLLAPAEDIGVADRVHFTGPVDAKKLPAVLRSADVVAHVPRFDNYGTAVLQAMACGVPVVTTAVGALADIVVDGTTGVLVPPSDPHALGHALHGLLTDSTRREMCRVAGADRAHSRYSWDRIGQETIAVYQDAIDDATARNGAAHPDPSTEAG